MHTFVPIVNYLLIFSWSADWPHSYVFKAETGIQIRTFGSDSSSISFQCVMYNLVVALDKSVGVSLIYKVNHRLILFTVR